jgi:hypothetical protein
MVSGILGREIILQKNVGLKKPVSIVESIIIFSTGVGFSLEAKGQRRASPSKRKYFQFTCSV